VSVAAVNDSEVLQRNLLMSPDINQGHLRLVECRGFKSASLAYNHGLDTTQEDIVVFVHQDVYLPKGWLAQVDQKILELEQTDPQWAVLGVFGVKPNGQEVGHVWCSGLQRELKKQCEQAQEVRSVDELAFLFRRSTNCRFDNMLPDWHLYGTDIILQADAKGLKSYVTEIPVIHNSRPIYSLCGGYVKSYLYMMKKWRNYLPVYTTIVPLGQYGYWLWRHILRSFLRGQTSERPGASLLNPREIAVRLGFE
jgi:glycosyltransferase involved in cell wall biosynthesis